MRRHRLTKPLLGVRRLVGGGKDRVRGVAAQYDAGIEAIAGDTDVVRVVLCGAFYLPSDLTRRSMSSFMFPDLVS